jgi:hypothetical protein
MRVVTGLLIVAVATLVAVGGAGGGAAPILHRAAQATQRRCRLYLRSPWRLLRRAFRAHAYRRLGTMERGPGRRF